MNKSPILITCPVCQAQISSQAAVCPRCGQPNSPQRQPPPVFYNQPPVPVSNTGKKPQSVLVGCLMVAIAVPLIGILATLIIPRINRATRQASDERKIQTKQSQTSDWATNVPPDPSQEKAKASLNPSGLPIDLVKQGESVYNRVNARYKYPVDVGATFLMNLPSYDVSLLIAKKEWGKLSREEQISLTYYAESLIPVVKASPGKYADEWTKWSGWDYPRERAISNIEKICSDCWAVVIGSPVRDGNRIDFTEDNRIDAEKGKSFRQSQKN